MSSTKGKVNWNPNYLWFKLLDLSLCYTLKSQEKQTVISKRTNTYNQHQTIASTERSNKIYLTVCLYVLLKFVPDVTSMIRRVYVTLKKCMSFVTFGLVV